MIKCLFHECSNPVENGSAKCVFHRNRTQCTAPNCRNQAYARGRCARHGARKQCFMDGCSHYRRAGGYCARHTTEIRHGIRKPVDKMCLNSQEPLMFGLPLPQPLDESDWETVLDLLCDDNNYPTCGNDWIPSDFTSLLVQSFEDAITSSSLICISI